MKKAIFSLIILWCSCYSFALEEIGDVAIHGFISQGYLGTTENDYFFSDTKDGTFQFNEMGLNFGTDVTDSLRLGIQFFAKDLGVIGNDKVTIDYAMADYYYRDWLGMRVGKIKKAHGLYNESRDVDAGRLSIFLPQSLYHEAYRDQMLAIKGVCLYGRFFEQLDYQVYYGIIDVALDSGVTYMFESIMKVPPLGYECDPLPGMNILWQTPLEGLSVGGTYTNYGITVNTAVGAIDISGYQIIGSIQYIYNDMMFSAEYSRQPNDISSGSLSLSNEVEYYYTTAAYRLKPWFEFGGGYSALYYDIDKRDEPEDYLKDLFLSLRFDINDYWIFKLECHSMDGVFFVTNPDPTEDWFMYAAKLTFSF